MNNKLVALLLAGVIASGLIYTHPAYAHNFGGDESASWLAKVAEIKTEVNNVSKHVGQKDVIDYYASALGEYWNSNDTREMGERNTLLQQEIPATINATLDDARAGNQSMVNDDVSKLGGYLDESVPVRVDKAKLDNSTVQALSVVFVVKEALEKYGTALNSTVDLNDMSQMNMSSGSMSGNGMSSGSMPANSIVNSNAYENSVSLATAAQQMFNDVATNNPSISDNAKISAGFTKLVQDLNNKADTNTIMMDVHVGIHPTLIMAYNIQGASAHGQSTVPEFPLPALLIVIAIAGVVVTTRLKSHTRF
ncbi:MAG: hypothetical protein PXX83_06765 [Candidatus Nitrosotalea sp.]|nr:hypothetical protein [Candidatus Nitrosotalea sp.]